MKLEYHFDLSEKSSSFIHTPSLSSQQLPFYVHNYGHYDARSGYYTKREGLDNFLLFFTISGSGIIIYRNEEYTIKTNQAAVIYCNEYHFYKTGNEGFWEFKWVHFNGTAGMNYFKLLNGDSFSVITLSDPAKVNAYIDEIPALSAKKDMLIDIKYSMYLTNILSELVICKTSSLNNKNYMQHNLIMEKAIAYINSNYNTKIALDDLADEIHVTKYHFIRLFKRYAGMSPYEYLINYRINRSKVLLKETNLTVNEIAYLVGFNDVNNYIKYFKKLVGTTPLRYRNYWIA